MVVSIQFYRLSVCELEQGAHSYYSYWQCGCRFAQMKENQEPMQFYTENKVSRWAVASPSWDSADPDTKKGTKDRLVTDPLGAQLWNKMAQLCFYSMAPILILLHLRMFNRKKLMLLCELSSFNSTKMYLQAKCVTFTIKSINSAAFIFLETCFGVS